MTLKLNELIARRLISFYLFIHHLPEEDENKPHKHLFIVPNGSLNTDQIQDYLQELDPTNPNKPLGCIFFKSSKFDDFYFYGLHDAEYLAMKGQKRKYTYTESEFKMSDLDYFTALKHEIDYTKLGNRKTIEIVNEIKAGATIPKLLELGRISAQNALQWRTVYEMFNSPSSTYRADRQTHTPLDTHEPTLLIDMESGEVEEDSPLVDAFEVATWHKKKGKKWVIGLSVEA